MHDIFTCIIHAWTIIQRWICQSCIRALHGAFFLSLLSFIISADYAINRSFSFFLAGTKRTVCSLQFLSVCLTNIPAKNGFVNHFQLHTYVKHSVISGDRSYFFFALTSTGICFHAMHKISWKYTHKKLYQHFDKWTEQKKPIYKSVQNIYQCICNQSTTLDWVLS